MSPSARFPIEETSQFGEARRHGLRLAAGLGFDETRAGQVAIVVTEACTNILKHAQSGEILIQVAEPGSRGPELELLSLDKGPGMQDIERCMQDGYSTGSSAGHGLGAIRRLADQTDFYSVPGEGTAILARWRAQNRQEATGMRTGVVNMSRHGEEFCGDSWGVEQDESFFTAMVADGLGHGYEASRASLEAIRIFRNHRDAAPAELIALVHRALRSLRGAAVAAARIDETLGRVTFSGLGNVTALIYANTRCTQRLVSMNGTAGHEVSRIQEFTCPWPSDGLLLMHSDGLSSSAGLETRPALARHDPTLIAGVLYRDFGRRHDDATVVVAKAA